MTRTTSWLMPLALVLAGCAAKTAQFDVRVEKIQAPPALVLWSLCPSPCIDLSARFAAYPSGTIIYWRAPPGFPSHVPEYIRADLSREQYERLLGQGRLELLEGLKQSYFVSNAINAPDNILQWRAKDGTLRNMGVTGVLDESEHWADRHRTPSGFLTIFDSLVSFDHPKARPYVPEATEVLLTPMSSSEGNNVAWPVDWPTPVVDPDRTESRGLGSLKAVLPGERFADAYKWVWERQELGQGAILQGHAYYIEIKAVLPGNPRIPKIPESALPCAVKNDVSSVESRTLAVSGTGLARSTR